MRVGHDAGYLSNCEYENEVEKSSIVLTFCIRGFSEASEATAQEGVDFSIGERGFHEPVHHDGGGSEGVVNREDAYEGGPAKVERRFPS